MPAQAAPAAARRRRRLTGRAARLHAAGRCAEPGPGFVVKSAYKVVFGVQTYSCVANPDGTGTWSTPASVPEALLKAYGSLRLIHHFEGPRWRALDGSTVLGAVAQRVPKDGTIPWLLLERHGAREQPARAGTRQRRRTSAG